MDAPQEALSIGKRKLAQASALYRMVTRQYGVCKAKTWLALKASGAGTDSMIVQTVAMMDGDRASRQHQLWLRRERIRGWVEWWKIRNDELTNAYWESLKSH